MRRQPRLGNGDKRDLLGSGKTKDLLDVQILGPRLAGQLPLKPMQEIRKAGLDDLEPRGITGAHPAA